MGGLDLGSIEIGGFDVYDIAGSTSRITITDLHCV